MILKILAPLLLYATNYYMIIISLILIYLPL